MGYESKVQVIQPKKSSSVALARARTVFFAPCSRRGGSRGEVQQHLIAVHDRPQHLSP